MKQTFRQRLQKLILFLFLAFVVLFIGRFIYDYTQPVQDNSIQRMTFQSPSITSRNFASKKYVVQSSSAAQSPTKVDQKYEKVAEINARSSEFEQEETKARQEIEKHEALIQFEQKSGNNGARKLNLVVGVPPENFDALYVQLIKIGKIEAKQITKKDKTNEYKELNAKKASLEKIRNSLVELKSKGGKIEEYMQLENRILEIEQQLQGLGVSLGDFDDENEFCTVKFALIEGKDTKISFIDRVFSALSWTILCYLEIMATLFFLTFFAYLLLSIIDKLKVFERLINRNDENDSNIKRY